MSARRREGVARCTGASSTAGAPVVGSSSSASYLDALQRFISALDLEDAVSITGGISMAGLEAHYRTADVFVCLSDHEGFALRSSKRCATTVPVVALASSAIPETADRHRQESAASRQDSGTGRGCRPGCSRIKVFAARSSLPGRQRAEALLVAQCQGSLCRGLGCTPMRSPMSSPLRSSGCRRS